MKYLLLISVAILSGCGPANLLKRAQKLEAKAILKGASVAHDTVFVDRTVIVPKIEIDTVVTNVNFRDTIVVTKDNVVTKIKINDVLRTVYVNTICPPDTLKIKVPFTVTKTIKAGYTNWQYYSVMISGILFGLVAGAILSKLLWR